MDHETVAHEIENWVQSAVFDMAPGDMQQIDRELYAEFLYNDAPTLRDVLGDKICDACMSGTRSYKAAVPKMILVAQEIKKISPRHKAMNLACDGLIADWEKRK